MPTKNQLKEELDSLIAAAKREFEENPYWRPKKIYLHWTGGVYVPNAIDKGEYNLLIQGDGSYVLGRPGFNYPTAATWKRNTGSFAIALCCCFNAVCSKVTGLPANTNYPPTGIQIENMARAVAELTGVFNLTLDGWDVMTHAEAADNLDGGKMYEPYGPLSTFEKWDLWQLTDSDDGKIRTGGEILRGKANWYRGNGI
jgi:hypothetical protein